MADPVSAFGAVLRVAKLGRSGSAVTFPNEGGPCLLTLDDGVEGLFTSGAFPTSLLLVAFSPERKPHP